MKNSLKIYLAPLALMLAACSSGDKSGAGAAASPGVPKEVEDAAKAQMDVSFKNCGDFWGSVYKKENPMDFTNPAEYQFKNLKMSVRPGFPPSQAQKMNGLQWDGFIDFSADVTRQRAIGSKDWYNWSDGFGAAYNAIEIQIVNGKVKMNGGTALRAACPQ